MRYIVFLLTLLISVNAYALVNWNSTDLGLVKDTLNIELDEDEVGLSITANDTQTSDLVQMFASDGTTNLFSVSGSGQILMPDGSASAPAYSFASNPDTGMWISGSQLSFTINGTPEFTVRSGLEIVANERIEASGFKSKGGSNITWGAGGDIGDNSTNNPTNIFHDGKSVPTPQSVSCTCSDDPTCGADATAGTLTLEPTSDSVRITNDDPNGCDVTMSETNAVDGHMVRISVVSNAGGSVDFADTSGVLETTGALSLGIYDVLGIEYVSDRWVEAFQSNN